MVAKYTNIKNNTRKVPVDGTSISHRTWKYYIKKVSDNFTSNMLGTGCYPCTLMFFWCLFEFPKDKSKQRK